MSDLSLPFVYNPALYPAELKDIPPVLLRRLGNPLARNDTQTQALPAAQATISGALADTDPLREKGAWYTVPQSAQDLHSINGQPIFQAQIFLFNLVISLEWQPSDSTVQDIRLAARRASDFLYDVTDGYMAIGQVLIGGPELLDAADIQVLASNRLHPRAWNKALHEPAKFQPVRLGRGLWQKNRNLLFQWSSPEGYRTLIHEWGHYAFGLVDRYLERRNFGRDKPDQLIWNDDRSSGVPITIAVPRIALPVETVMANQEISEYADIDQAFQMISQLFERNITRNKILSGPEELPLPLPIYPQLSWPQEQPAAQELQLPLQRFFDTLDAARPAAPPPAEQIPPRLNPNDEDSANTDSHWLYVLKYDSPRSAADLPRRIVAQGKLSSRDTQAGFQLLGADPGDQVVIISEAGGRVWVHGGILASDGVAQWENLTPYDATTSVFEAPFFIDVIPETLVGIEPKEKNTPRIVNVAVGVTANRQPDDVVAYPYGAGQYKDMEWATATQTSASRKLTPNFKKVGQLDGHILLRWRGAADAASRLFICSYSQGGGPASIGGKPSISGGSAEGNAMLFFLSPEVVERAKLGRGAVEDATDDQLPDGYWRVRIVTTVLPAHEPLSVDGAAPTPDTIAPRSYIFSMASNESLADYAATLVLYYDDGATKYGGSLLVYRWDYEVETWQRLTTIVPSDLTYVAVPLTKDTAEMAPSFSVAQPATVRQDPRIERYRILWRRDPPNTSNQQPTVVQGT